MHLYLLFNILLFATNVLAYGWGMNFDSTWMKYINGNLRLNQINIPGTHDTATYSLTNVIDSTGRTQTLNIMQQLNSGIRYFDIRLGYVDNGRININHEIFTCKDDFESILNECLKFLSNEQTKSETIILHLKNEAECLIPKSINGKVLYTDCTNERIEIVNKLTNNAQFYYTKDEIPILENVRGKIVIATREYDYKGSNYNGLIIPIFRDSKATKFDQYNSVSYDENKFILNLTYTFRIQDSYDIDHKQYNYVNDQRVGIMLNLDKKWNAIKSLIDIQKDISQGTSNILAINFLNVADIDGIIEDIALDINERLRNELSKLGAGKEYGWIIMDFATAETARYIYQANNFVRCGANNGGLSCQNSCCSQYGFCGDTGDYCGVGCQANYGICGYNKPIGDSKDSTCGHVNGLRCINSCCSKFGYCGTTDEHCLTSNGCQSNFGECK